MRCFDIIPTLLLMLAMTCGGFGCGGPSQAGLEARKNAYTRIDKVNTQIGYSQSRQAFETGQLQKALDLIEESVARHPDPAEYHLLQGRILLEMHRLDEARTALETAIERDERQAEAHYFLGIVYQRWSEDAEAYGHYMQAATIEESKPQYLLAAAETLVSLKQYEEADALVRAHMRTFEHHPSFRHLLGQVAQLQGNQADAARLYKEASILQADNMQLLEELASAQFAAEDITGCLDTLRVLEVRDYPFNSHLDLLKARCLVHTNRLLEARPLYKKLRLQLPHDPILWEESGWLAWSLQDWRGLREAGLQASALSPGHSGGWILLGVVEREEGELESAEANLVKAVSCDDAGPLAWVLLARIRLQLGDDVGASDAWTDATKLDETLTEQPLVTSVLVTDG